MLWTLIVVSGTMGEPMRPAASMPIWMSWSSVSPILTSEISRVNNDVMSVVSPCRTTTRPEVFGMHTSTPLDDRLFMKDLVIFCETAPGMPVTVLST